MLIKSTKSLHINSLKMIIYGEPGAGKTTLASTIKEPTLIISAEAGLLSLNGHDIDVVDISQDDEGSIIPKEKRIARLFEVYKFLLTAEAKRKYRWIFIDSITEIAQNLLESLHQEFPDRKDTLVLYGENGKRMRSLIKSFRDLPHYNVVFTALSEREKDETGRYYLGISMPGKISQAVPAFFDEVLYLHTAKDEQGNVDRVLVSKKTDNNVCKDRSSKLLPVEKPDLSIIAGKIQNQQPKEKESKK